MNRFPICENDCTIYGNYTAYLEKFNCYFLFFKNFIFFNDCFIDSFMMVKIQFSKNYNWLGR